MKAISLLLLVPLVGCSLAPLAELEDHYFQCTSDGAQGCNLIAEEIDRRYELVAKRAQRELTQCNKLGVTCISGAEAREYLKEWDRAIFESY